MPHNTRKTIGAYWKIIRPLNLFIVALSMCAVKYSLLVFPTPAWKNAVDLQSEIGFALLVLATILSAAAGYVINDLLDIQTDKINKPEKAIVSVQISLSQAKNYYLWLLSSGLVISLFIAFFKNPYQEPIWVLLYPIANLGLYGYSKYLKGTPLAGNLFVAFFCAAVVVLVWFFEKKHIDLYAVSNIQVQTLWLYVGFAFFTTFSRELIKDMEDYDGDKTANLRTFPVVFGLKKSKFLALVSFIPIFALLVWGFLSTPFSIVKIIVALSLVVIPVVVSMLYLSGSDLKRHFHRSELFIKIAMVGGLVYLAVV